MVGFSFQGLGIHKVVSTSLVFDLFIWSETKTSSKVSKEAISAILRHFHKALTQVEVIVPFKEKKMETTI